VTVGWHTNEDGDLTLASGAFVAAVWPGSKGARWWIRLGGTTIAADVSPDLAAASPAAEAAARQYAASILAALPPVEPSAEDVERVAAYFVEHLRRAGFHGTGRWRLEIIARAALRAGLDVDRLSKETDR